MIRLYVIAIVLILALAGCATPERRIQVQTVEVKVPVRVPCVSSAPVVPTYQYGKGPWPGMSPALALLVSDLEAAQQYGREWEAATAGCLMVKAETTPAGGP